VRCLLLVFAALALAGCTTLPPEALAPVGFSTYGRTPDGKRVKLWTDYATGTTTGTIGGQSVGQLHSY
jgi:hypothetical protein